LQANAAEIALQYSTKDKYEWFDFKKNISAYLALHQQGKLTEIWTFNLQKV